MGLSSHLFWFSQSYDLAALAQIRAGGVSWIRDDFDWDRIEPSPGVFDWSRTDNLMAAAAKTGTHVLGILTFSPPWASTDPTAAHDRNYPPAAPADYAHFAAAVAGRYGSGGTFWASHPDLPPDPLAAVELWNEPWGYWAWKPNPDPRAYAQLAHLGAEAVRATDPRIQILLPGDIDAFLTGHRSQPWLSSLLQADPGLGRTVDALSVHPYPSWPSMSPMDDSRTASLSYRRVPLSRQIAQANGLDLPVWITEIGWSTAPNLPGAVSEAKQAQYDREAIIRALTEWSNFVPRIFVYTWERSTGAAGDFNGNLGLLRADGSPKPAWPAIVDLLTHR